MIDFASLPARLRALVAGGIAVVLGGLVLLAFKDVLSPTVQVTVYGGKAVSIAPLFLAAIAVLMILAWTYVLAGSITAHAAVRVTAVGLFAVAILPVARSAGRIPGGEIVLAMAGFYVLWRGRRGGGRPGQDAVALGGLVGAVHALAAVGALRGEEIALYAVGLSTHVVRCVFLPFPLLVISGLDLAEVAAMVSGWAVAAVRRMAPDRVLAGLVLTVVLFKTFVWFRGGPAVSPAWLSTAIFLVLLGLAARSLPSPGAEIEAPYWLLLAFSISYLAGPLLGSVVLVISRGWVAAQMAHVVQVGWIAVTAVWLAVAAVIWRRAGSPVSPHLVVATLAAWLLLTLVPDALNVVLGWSPRLSGIRMPVLDMQASLAVGALTVYWLATGRGDARHWTAALMILATLSALRGMHALLEQDVEVADLYNLVQIGGLIVTTIIVTRAGTGTRAAWPAAAAGAALFGLFAWLVLAGKSAGSQAYLAQVLILILALTWDLLSSGERFANEDSPAMPRGARLLIYLGAMLIAAAAMLWFNTPQGLDPEIYRVGVISQLGLVMLGTPLLLLSFVKMLRVPQEV